MALIKCPECGREVSDTAETCPHCGYRLKEKPGNVIFLCPASGGWNEVSYKHTCDVTDVETGRIVKSFEMGQSASYSFNKKVTLEIHVHGYFGRPRFTLYPGHSYHCNIQLRMGGTLGGGNCDAQVEEIGPNGSSSSAPRPTVSGGKGGCYVATCVYGSYDCPQVWTLRRFRDYKLNNTWYGRLFIKLYYAISPTLVKWFGKTKWFKKMWKGKLDRMVEKYKALGYEDTPYDDLY